MSYEVSCMRAVLPNKLVLDCRCRPSALAADMATPYRSWTTGLECLPNMEINQLVSVGHTTTCRPGAGSSATCFCLFRSIESAQLSPSPSFTDLRHYRTSGVLLRIMSICSAPGLHLHGFPCGTANFTSLHIHTSIPRSLEGNDPDCHDATSHVAKLHLSERRIAALVQITDE